ncbi:MAG: GDP-mannose 4,6-dehydratase [Chloroflexi bacterium]|nr:GDP-mannose 4,6-dehydratase [Chloroflexota bacterium]
MGWHGRKVLVTGAGGFIGSHLTEALVRLGAQVRAFIRYTSRADVGLLTELPDDILKQVEIIAGDLRDQAAVKEASQGTTHIFHLGALIAIPYSYLHPAEVVETNVIGTLNILLAARELGAERVISTSTSEVYGTARQVPIPETHPLQGQSPYSASKIGADKLAESFYCAYDLPVVTVRPFNTYGPRQSARAVIPTIITQALTCDKVLLGNLTPRRDLTYVSDTVDGFLRAATGDGVLGETINLGANDEIRIGDLAQTIIRLIGRPVDIVVDPERLRPELSEVMRLWSDNRRAKQLLGWEPCVSLEEGLRRTIDWIAKHLDRYQIGKYMV